MAKKKSRSNKKLLLLLLLLIPIGFVTYFVLIDEPTQYQVQADDPVTPTINEEIVIELPPIEEVFDLAVPIPEFDVPIEISFTPIITITDSLGVEDVVRGETTFLQALTGLDIIQVGIPDKTFDNGKLKIELEFDTGNIFSREIFLVKPSLDVVTIESGGTFTNTFAVPPKTSQGTDVISVIGIETQTPDCSLELPCIIGTSTGGIFTINIFESPIGDIPQGESITTNFILTQLDVNISEDIPVGIPELDPTPMPVIVDPPLQEEPLLIVEVFQPIIPQDTQTRIEPVNFALVGSTQIYSVTFANVDLIVELVEQMVNTTEIVVEEIIVEDIPNNPCPDVKFDSISFLFPTNEISGTTALWDKTPVDFFDIINIDIRNNRNCDLDIAIGSKWRAVTGQLFISDIAQINILTNQTIPFRSIAFDASLDCGVGSCSGLEIQWCFFGQVSTTDPVEIINEFCGKKFFRL